MSMAINYHFAEFLGGGPKTYPDAYVVSSEGHVIPVHMFVFRMGSADSELYQQLDKAKEAGGEVSLRRVSCLLPITDH
jgi:hypothetical protein